MISKQLFLCLGLFMASLLLPDSGLQAQIVLNELMTDNQSTLLDEEGDSPDWVELYNAYSFPARLVNWGLTDNKNEPDKWTLPDTTLQAGQFLIVFLSGKDRTSGPWLHANFKLHGNTEATYLYNSEGERIDKMGPLCIPENISYGRQPDGSNQYAHFQNASPGSTNAHSPTLEIDFHTDTVLFSANAGFYPHAFELKLSASRPETQIYYTLDGSEPKQNDFLYTKPIAIHPRDGEEDVLANLKTATDWQPPKEPGFKGQVIRATAYNAGCRANQPLTHTYFVNEKMAEKYPVNIVSISLNKKDFFDYENGIYVEGVHQRPDDLRASGNSFQTGKAWERDIHLELFQADGQLILSQDAGIRTHGNMSRGFPQKSLRIYARDTYGKEQFSARLFPHRERENFDAFLLRAVSTDISGILFKDVLCHELVKDLNLEYMDSKPAVVFVNGEYWGIHNLREYQNENYLAHYHSVNPEHIDLLADNSVVKMGDPLHYNYLLDFLQTKDLTKDENYETLKGLIDIDNFITYHIAEMYFANFDWPDANIKYWRPKVQDGRWRWLFFDCDRCFIKYTFDQLTAFYEPTPDWSHFILNRLLQNENFRQQFVQSLVFHLQNTFEASHVLNSIEKLEKTYTPLVAEQVNRWNQPASVSFWHSQVNEMKTFALLRPIELLRQLEKNFGIPFHIYPNPCSKAFGIDIDLPGNTAVSISLYDRMGREEFVQDFPPQTNWQHTLINVEQLPAGIHIVKVRYGQMIFTRKLQIIR